MNLEAPGTILTRHSPIVELSRSAYGTDGQPEARGQNLICPKHAETNGATACPLFFCPGLPLWEHTDMVGAFLRARIRFLELQWVHRSGLIAYNHHTGPLQPHCGLMSPRCLIASVYVHDCGVNLRRHNFWEGYMHFQPCGQ